MRSIASLTACSIVSVVVTFVVEVVVVVWRTLIGGTGIFVVDTFLTRPIVIRIPLKNLKASQSASLTGNLKIRRHKTQETQRHKNPRAK